MTKKTTTVATVLNTCTIMKMFLLCIFSIFFSSCNNTLENDITEHIDTNCDTCTIDLRQITDFDWSKFYYFPFGTHEGDISAAIGQEFPMLNYFNSCIVFLDKNDSIVFYEEYDREYENPYYYFDGEIDYLPYTQDYLLFTSPYFKYKVNKYNRSTYYELYQDE